MQKVLVLDIETQPMVAYVWDRKDVNIALNHIKSEWSIIAWSAKWLGDSPSKIIYKDVSKQKDYSDDKAILEPLWKLIDEADIIVTQNGQSFDLPRLNARFILHGMKPPSPYTHLDTYRIVRKIAAFTSNKLEYLTDKLCTKYKKLRHGKYPGMELWKQCLNGNMDAWAEMRRYNIHDVLSTEELYLKLRAWTPESMPRPHLSNIPEICGVCGKNTVTKEGTRIAKTGKYQRLHCTSCGTWSKGERIKDTK